MNLQSLQNLLNSLNSSVAGSSASGSSGLLQAPTPTKGQALSEAFGSMSAQPSDFAPITAATMSGFSQEMPVMQTNPYGSAAANKGLLELLQNAYSLGV